MLKLDRSQARDCAALVIQQLVEPGIQAVTLHSGGSGVGLELTPAPGAVDRNNPGAAFAPLAAVAGPQARTGDFLLEPDAFATSRQSR